MSILIADSGSTKCEWCILSMSGETHLFTQGMSPYFLNAEQLAAVVHNELLPQLKEEIPAAVYFYGTGCKDPNNAKKVNDVLLHQFPEASIHVTHDLMGAARALCQHSEGIACILGTGSNSCSYDGDQILKNSPGLGFVLGDEGSGAYLGIKIIQYYLYEIFEAELKEKFERTFQTSGDEILENVYRKPLPNRYLASFTTFLSANRGHFMIENIIEDGLMDFFENHVNRYDERDHMPVHFCGGIAYYFRDVVEGLCETYQLKKGTILKNPMEGLVKYHLNDSK